MVKCEQDRTTHITTLSGALLAYSLMVVTESEAEVEIAAVPQPSSSPATTCSPWYSDTGSCAYYTFGCDYSQVLYGSMVVGTVYTNPVETWPVCFKGRRQSPIHLSQDNAIPMLVDPGSVAFTGYNNILSKNPFIRSQGYGMLMNLEETVGRKEETTVEALISDNKHDKYNKWKGKTYKRKLNISKRKKHKKKGRNKRQIIDWLWPSSSRQLISPEIPSITGGPLSTNRLVYKPAGCRQNFWTKIAAQI